MRSIKFSGSYAGPNNKPAPENAPAPFAHSMKDVELQVRNRRLLMILLSVLAALVMITVFTALVKN